MTKYGFYSIVQVGKEFHVRGREKKDLENLLSEAGLSVPITEKDDADYRYRLIIKKPDISKIFSTLEKSIDYPSFKDEITHPKGIDYNQNTKVRAYQKISSVMEEVQRANKTS